MSQTSLLQKWKDEGLLITDKPRVPPGNDQLLAKFNLTINGLFAHFPMSTKEFQDFFELKCPMQQDENATPNESDHSQYDESKTTNDESTTLFQRYNNENNNNNNKDDDDETLYLPLSPFGDSPCRPPALLSPSQFADE